MSNNDYYLGKVSAEVTVDTTNLEVGVETSIKKLDQLSKTFQAVGKSINADLRAVNKSVQVNTNATAVSIAQMQKQIVSQLKLLSKQFTETQKATSADMSLGLQKLAITSTNNTSIIVKNLREIQKESNKVQSSLGKGKGINIGAISIDTKSLTAGLADATRASNGFYASLGKSFQLFSAISFKIFLIEQGLSQMAGIFESIIAPGLKFFSAMETNQVGMAGILSSMVRVNGESLRWEDSLAISKNIIKDLNVEAAKTAATSEELVSTFRALLAPGLGAGMTIDEIKKLTTVGVNAVKSIGLDGRQLVQELRDLVQGGIQPASSTLATSLGLKDADIKAARESAEGLFNFLMRKLEGFKYSSETTGTTLKGMFDQVVEGYTLASAVGAEPIAESLKEILGELRELIFGTEIGKMNDDFLVVFVESGEHIANLIRGLKEISESILPPILPMLKLIGGGLGFITDNTELILNAFMLFNLANAIQSMRNFNGATLETVKAIKQLTLAEQERLAVENVVNSTVIANVNKQVSLAQQQALINSTSKNLIKNGYVELANSIQSVQFKLVELGMSSKGAAKVQATAAKLASQGYTELAQKILDVSVQTATASKAQIELNNYISKLSSYVSNASTALGSLGIILTTLSDDQESWEYSLGSSAIQIGILTSAISPLIGKLGELAKAYLGVSTAAKMAGLLSVGAKTAAGALAVGGAVAIPFAGAYAMANDIGIDEAFRRYFENPNKTKDTSKAKSAQEKAQEKYLKDLESQLKVLGKEDAQESKNVKGAKNAYKALEQQLKTDLTFLKNAQESLNASYKNNLVGVQTYVETSLSLTKKQLDAEIENLKKRKEIAEQMGQQSDVERFNSNINELENKKLVAEQEAVRKLVEEYKNLDKQLDAISKEYYDILGITEEAFNDELIKKYASDYALLLSNTRDAQIGLDNALKSGSEQEIVIWQERLRTLKETTTELNKISEMKRLGFKEAQAQSEVERINLEIQDKYISSQNQVNRLAKTSANSEGDLFDFRKERMEDYIDAYTDIIALNEKMAENATSTSMFNQYKQQALEAKEALLELTDAVPPFQKVIKESVIDNLSEAFQSIALGEKSAREAFEDFGMAIIKTWNAKIFDELATVITDGLFQGLLPSNEKVGNRQKEIESIVTDKKANLEVTAELTTFENDTAQAALTFQESITNTMIPSLNTLSSVIMEGVVPALMQVSTAGGVQISNIGNTPLGEDNLGFGTLRKDYGSYLGIGTDYFTNSNDALKELTGNAEKLGNTFISAKDFTKGFAVSADLATEAQGANTGALNQSSGMALPLMITSLLSASGILGKFGIVVQGVMMAMQIAKSAGILGFANGGYVSGAGTSTSDSIPARLSNGEYVMKASAVRTLGVDFLDRLNSAGKGFKSSGNLPKFRYADGGLVNVPNTEDTAVNKQVAPSPVTVTMVNNFQSLDPEANMKAWQAQYPMIKSQIIKDMQTNTGMRNAIKGASR